jgi:hypothetical protein
MTPRDAVADMNEWFRDVDHSLTKMKARCSANGLIVTRKKRGKQCRKQQQDAHDESM